MRNAPGGLRDTPRPAGFELSRGYACPFCAGMSFRVR